MDIYKLHRAKIVELEKRLALELGYYQKALKDNVGFLEANRLFMAMKRTERDISQELRSYYKSIGLEPVKK